jgi:gp16 family phage-associated protein
MKPQFKRNPQEAREELESQGISIARWAAKNGVSSNLASAVLRGEQKCLRGECHKIAVLLGIKDGVVAE